MTFGKTLILAGVSLAIGTGAALAQNEVPPDIQNWMAPQKTQQVPAHRTNVQAGSSDVEYNQAAHPTFDFTQIANPG